MFPSILTGDPNVEVCSEPLAIQPNYLKYPSFPYSSDNVPRTEDMNGSVTGPADCQAGSTGHARRPQPVDGMLYGKIMIWCCCLMIFKNKKNLAGFCATEVTTGWNLSVLYSNYHE